ncbi:putative serine protease K12H4.7 [Drosophila grimshawi]|uniref:putative serine protease K12H4.7 n=1 Tax=Drosophila grimshawi TaxID=7222 RepID=UPI000C86F902|nr:putative serine protease K12H4.7 [Drosophila grimshawi]
MAVENAGILFYTEHRYYGQSLPHNHNSMSLENLKHLNLHQALADLACFIRYQKSHSANLTHSKVILIGGSYSGSMVAWMTQLYPELVTASWASSAPLLAKANFYEYMQFVGNSINLTYGHNCTQRLENGFNHLVKLFNTNKISKLLERLDACASFNASDLLDRISFFNGIGNYFALVVQSYSEYIPALCNTLMSLHSSDELALERFLERLYSGDDKRLREFRCQDFSYKAMLEVFSDVSDRSTGTRAWFYQTCNQFGWYTTTTTTNCSTSASSCMSFGSQVPVWYFEQLCRDTFGPGQTPAALAMGIAEMNAQFGGFEFNQSVVYRELFFTHGELDPWRALGHQLGNQAVIIAGYSHVEDLASVNVRDSVQMNLVKLRIMSFLRRHVAS